MASWSRGVTRLDGSRGKKQVWRPSEANVLYWGKCLWYFGDFSAHPTAIRRPPQWFGPWWLVAGGISPLSIRPCPEVLLRHSSNCFANNLMLCIARSERYFRKLKLILWHLLSSMTNSKSGQVVWSSFEYRNGRNRESWQWWNHKRICFDKGTLSFVSISIFCYLKQEKPDYIDVSMELCFSNTSDTSFALNNLLYNSD